MPRCETCGSTVHKNDIFLNNEKDRTECVRCQAKGAVHPKFSRYITITVGDGGIEVFGETNSVQLSYENSWGGIVSDLRGLKKELSSIGKPKLQLVGQ